MIYRPDVVHDGVFRGFRFLTAILLGLTMMGTAASPAWSAPASQMKARKPPAPSAAGKAAMDYALAISSGDQTKFGQLDFACQYRMVEQRGTLKNFPPAPDGIYADCWNRLKEAIAPAIWKTDEGMDTIWPGPGRLVFFTEPLESYQAAAAVMDLLGQSPPGTGLTLSIERQQTIPNASFPAGKTRKVAGVQTSLVQLRVAYKDMLTSPVTFAKGAYRFRSTIHRPRVPVKSVAVQFVVMTGLKRLGYPSDAAVLSVPVSVLSDAGDLPQTGELPTEAIPFSTETSHVLADSATIWQPSDGSGLLIAAVARSRHFPDLRDRIALLNRVLLIDDEQPEALTAMTNDLYGRVLATGDAVPSVPFKDAMLAKRVSELSWNWYAQNFRLDLSNNMEMGGLAEPTAGDFLYRMIPAMETLSKVRPKDLDNRLHLGIAYRWNNDQLRAIQTHEALVNDLAQARPGQRARALIELAWSRIHKVSWNRHLNDPDINQAYREAEEAFRLTDDPLDKFTAAYTMAYSQLYMAERDPKLMLANLTQAKQFFELTPGATTEVWSYLLNRDSLKALLDADPTFQPLLTAMEAKPKPKKD
ncbi:MAG TPA: hypothetical protein VLA99_08350 [Nitrospiraceae bacterium]|nr:hypothetical protein [Nitrospiraceae bacterium]